MCDIFWNNCRTGNLELIKTFLKSNKIYIHTSCEHGFRLACINNHLHVMKYLALLYKTGYCNIININICREYAFRYGCYNININIVKFLTYLHRKDKNYSSINIYEKSLYGDCFRSLYNIDNNSRKKLVKYLYNLGNYREHLITVDI